MGEEQARSRGLSRVWAFSLGYFAVGIVLAGFAANSEPPFEAPFHLPWYLFAAAFALTERFTVHLEVRRDSHTLSFTEVVAAIGLIFANPLQLVLARVLTSVGVLALHRRVAPVKLIFNAGSFAFDIGFAILLYHALLGGSSPVRPAGWIAALVALGLANAIAALAVFVVMRLAGAPVAIRSHLLVGAVSFSSATSGTAVALAAASVLWFDRSSWVLLAFIAIALGYFFVSFIRIRERHRDLANLHEYTTTLMEDRSTDDLPKAAALGIASLLKADRVVILIPADPTLLIVDASEGEVTLERTEVSRGVELDAAVEAAGPAAGVSRRIAGVALNSEDVITARLSLPDRSGLVIVDGRESAARAFDDEDVQLLETATGHAAAALQNAELVNKLREEARFRAHQALHDDVTDLPNQRGLVEQLQGQLRAGVDLVMLTVRVHSLREVNETLGRSVGDEMLRKVAERLVPIGRRSWCARSGTDEFTLVVPGGQEDADDVANQIVAAFENPVQCTDVALAVTVGIGVALAPEHGTDGEMLVRRASLAASRSALDGTTVTTWAEDRDPYDPQRLTIAADLRDAIPAGELEVHFQPQVDMESGAVTGAEALVRWAHPRLGPLRPDQFIPAAEHTGAIDALTFHVLTVAVETGRRWHDRGWDIEMAVNLSARNLTSPRFAAHVAQILEAADFPASSLTLELTESSVMTEAGRALATLDELHALGIELSIDDFGTGYSSLAHLRRLPVNEIKIDKSFVFDLTTNESDEAIVKSMVELGHTLSLRVVVEGVETVEVRDRLAKIGSDRLQGYLVSRPLPASAFEHWMQERQVRAAQADAGPGSATVVNLQARR